MDILNITFIAFGLAMDAFAVSITSGLSIKNLKAKHALRIALFFGLFQAIMPLIGWVSGLSIIDLILNIDHWVAFILLSFIGCKMIYESTKIESDKIKTNPLNIHTLLLLSIATSIDALAVGVSFAFLQISIITPVIIIGLITFILSFVGVFIGDLKGHLFQGKIEILGGIILIGIGLKILLEHLYLN